MKKIFLIFIVGLFQQTINAQTTSSDIGKINLAVVMPENIEGLDASQLSKLETKITQVATESGLAAAGYGSNFVIYPKFAIYETNTVEGGMQNIVVTTTELSLFIKQVDNNMLFSSVSKTLKGSGTNQATSITNAISKIDGSDAKLKEFIATAKDKIIKYFESKCGDIITQSDNLVKKQEYEKALGLLMTVPEGVSCYSKVQAKSIDVYKAYQNKQCKVLLHDANVSITANDYGAALESLKRIDPAAACANEADAMLRKIAPKITAEQKRDYDMYVKMYNDDVSLEKLRINAAKDVASAYYKSTTPVVYSYLVR